MKLKLQFVNLCAIFSICIFIQKASAYDFGCNGINPDHQDVTYKTANGLELKLDLYLPQNSDSLTHPLVIWIHGGGWGWGDKASVDLSLVPCFITNEGFVLASINYRLSTQPQFTSYKDTIADVKDAVRWLRSNASTYGINPNKIGSWGGSAGGHLSARGVIGSIL